MIVFFHICMSTHSWLLSVFVTPRLRDHPKGPIFEGIEKCQCSFEEISWKLVLFLGWICWIHIMTPCLPRLILDLFFRWYLMDSTLGFITLRPPFWENMFGTFSIKEAIQDDILHLKKKTTLTIREDAYRRREPGVSWRKRNFDKSFFFENNIYLDFPSV